MSRDLKDDGQLILTSNGLPSGTHILTGEGVPLEGVVRVSFAMDGENPGVLFIEAIPLTVAVSSTVVYMDLTCPNCAKTFSHQC